MYQRVQSWENFNLKNINYSNASIAFLNSSDKEYLRLNYPSIDWEKTTRDYFETVSKNRNELGYSFISFLDLMVKAFILGQEPENPNSCFFDCWINHVLPILENLSLKNHGIVKRMVNYYIRTITDKLDQKFGAIENICIKRWYVIMVSKVLVGLFKIYNGESEKTWVNEELFS